jgi:hypothetical protein
MHFTDFVIDRDVLDSNHIFFPRTLSVGIQSGRLVFPAIRPENNPGEANRLLIFTGTVAAELRGDHRIKQGVIRIQLHNPLPTGVKFIGSATVAGLAALHTDDDQVLFGVNAAETVLGPNPDGSLPDGLPHDDLYVIIDVSVQSEDAHLDRISYQANVLVRDTNPELESILVRPHGSLSGFQPIATVGSGEAWDYQITLTGPVLRPTELILLSSSNPAQIPIGPPAVNNLGAVELRTNQVSAVFTAPHTRGEGIGSKAATITASFTRLDQSVMQKTATVAILEQS